MKLFNKNIKSLLKNHNNFIKIQNSQNIIFEGSLLEMCIKFEIKLTLIPNENSKFRLIFKRHDYTISKDCYIFNLAEDIIKIVSMYFFATQENRIAIKNNVNNKAEFLWNIKTLERSKIFYVKVAE
jgi:hypothetical protein